VYVLETLRRDFPGASTERLLVMNAVDVVKFKGRSLSAGNEPILVSNVMLVVVNPGGRTLAVVVRFVVDAVVVVVVEVDGNDTVLQVPRLFSTS
jgi:hypothetical protein